LLWIASEKHHQSCVSAAEATTAAPNRSRFKPVDCRRRSSGAEREQEFVKRGVDGRDNRIEVAIAGGGTAGLTSANRRGIHTSAAPPFAGPQAESSTSWPVSAS
jgi:hypothetical protein